MAGRFQRPNPFVLAYAKHAARHATFDPSRVLLILRFDRLFEEMEEGVNIFAERTYGSIEMFVEQARAFQLFYLAELEHMVQDTETLGAVIFFTYDPSDSLALFSLNAEELNAPDEMETFDISNEPPDYNIN